MNTVIRLVGRSFKKLPQSNNANSINGIDELVHFHPKRFYKNFGHGRETDPLSSRLYVGFLVFVILIGPFTVGQWVYTNYWENNIHTLFDH